MVLSVSRYVITINYKEKVVSNFWTNWPLEMQHYSIRVCLLMLSLILKCVFVFGITC